MPEENKVVDLLESIKLKQDHNQVLHQLTSDEVKALSDKVVESESSTKESLEKVATDAEEFKSLIIKQIESVTETGTYLEKAITRMGNGGVDPDEDECKGKAEVEFANLLRYGTALSDDTNEYICRHMINNTYKGLSEDSKALQVKELVAGINNLGGYLVLPDQQALMDIRFFESSPMRQIAAMMTTTTDSMQFPINDDEFESAGWVGETTDRTDTITGNATIGLITILVAEHFAQPQITQKMVEDSSIDIEAWIVNKITAKLAREENTAFTLGDGSQKPKGFLSYPAWVINDNTGIASVDYQRGALEYRGMASPSMLSGDDLKFLQNSLKEPYQAGAVWLMNRRTFGFVITLKDDRDQYIFRDRFLSEQDGQTLLGRRVLFFDDMPEYDGTALTFATAVTGQEAGVIAYGNFGEGYTIVERRGLRIQPDQITKKGTILFYATKRVGGAVTNYEAIKILWAGTYVNIPDGIDAPVLAHKSMISQDKPSTNKASSKK